MGVTVHDVAREARVSIATVSRVLREKGVVSPELSERVRSTAERLGYVPNRVGQALRQQTANTWSVLIPELNAFFAQVVASVEAEAAETGTSVYLGVTNYDLDQGMRLIESALSQHCSGLIIAGVPIAAELLQNVRIPVVIVDRYLDDTWDAVLLDNHRAGQLAGEHLLDLGRSRPVCITGREPGVPVRIRAEGFAAALADGGVVLRGEAVREVELTIRDGNEAMSALLAAQPDLDSVYCASGPLSMGAYFALQEQGARDVALVANDDEDWMAIAAPSVTTVRQPTDLIGKSAANLLRERIADPTAAPRTIVLEPMLIVRDTSTPTTVLRAPSGEEREERMA